MIFGVGSGVVILFYNGGDACLLNERMRDTLGSMRVSVSNQPLHVASICAKHSPRAASRSFSFGHHPESGSLPSSSSTRFCCLSPGFSVSCCAYTASNCFHFQDVLFPRRISISAALLCIHAQNSWKTRHAKSVRSLRFQCFAAIQLCSGRCAKVA